MHFSKNICLVKIWDTFKEHLRLPLVSKAEDQRLMIVCVETLSLNPTLNSLIQISLAVTCTYRLLNLGNRQHVTGKPGTGTVMGNFSVGGVLTSPFFPSQYPRDLGAEYIISCLADNSPDCRVRLLFNDFQLAGVSIMEVLYTILLCRW